MSEALRQQLKEAKDAGDIDVREYLEELKKLREQPAPAAGKRKQSVFSRLGAEADEPTGRTDGGWQGRKVTIENDGGKWGHDGFLSMHGKRAAGSKPLSGAIHKSSKVQVVGTKGDLRTKLSGGGGGDLRSKIGGGRPSKKNLPEKCPW